MPSKNEAGRRRVVRSKVTNIKPTDWKPGEQQKPQPEDEVLSEIRQGVILIGGWRQAMNELKQKVDKVQPQVVEAMQQHGIKTIDVEGGTFSHSATIVEGSSLVLDEDKLAKFLTVKQWDAITKLVLDRTLLEDAISKGIVDAKVVARCSSEKPRTLFVKITTKKKGA